MDHKKERRAEEALRRLREAKARGEEPVYVTAMDGDGEVVRLTFLDGLLVAMEPAFPRGGANP